MSDPTKVMDECNPEGRSSVQDDLWKRLNAIARDMDKIRCDVANLDVNDEEEAKSAEWWMDRFHSEKDRADNQAAHADKLAKAHAEAVDALRCLYDCYKGDLGAWSKYQLFQVPKTPLLPSFVALVERIISQQTTPAPTKEPCPECKGVGCRFEWPNEQVTADRIPCPSCQPKEGKRIREEDLGVLEKALEFHGSRTKEALGRIKAAAREWNETLDWAHQAGTQLARAEAAEEAKAIVENALMAQRDRFQEEVERLNETVKFLHQGIDELEAKLRESQERVLLVSNDRDRLKAELAKVQAKPRPCGLQELPGLPAEADFDFAGIASERIADPAIRKAVKAVAAFARRALEAAGIVTDDQVLDLIKYYHPTSYQHKCGQALKKLRGA